MKNKIIPLIIVIVTIVIIALNVWVFLDLQGVLARY